MTIITQECLRDIWDEWLTLARMHWEETEMYRHGQGFNPDKIRYLDYESLGLYYHFAVRAGEELVGSAGVYVMPSMHTQRLIALEDTYYIRPDYRGKSIGPRLFKYVEDFVFKKGAVEAMLTTPLTNLQAERIVQFMGYQQVSKGWSKSLME